MAKNLIDIFAAVRLLAFDQDGTLYKYNAPMVSGWHRTQGQVISDLSRGTISPDEGLIMARDSYNELKNPWLLAARRLFIDPKLFHDAFHVLADDAHIEPLPELKDAFTRAGEAGLTSAVISHSHRCFIDRVLDNRLGIGTFIAPQHRISLEQVGFMEKHVDRAMFDEVGTRTGIAAEHTLVVEDTLHNLPIPKTMGSVTAYIHWGKPLATMPAYVDAQFETPVIAMNAITHAKRLALRRAGMLNRRA